MIPDRPRQEILVWMAPPAVSEKDERAPDRGQYSREGQQDHDSSAGGGEGVEAEAAPDEFTQDASSRSDHGSVHDGPRSARVGRIHRVYFEELNDSLTLGWGESSYRETTRVRLARAEPDACEVATRSIRFHPGRSR
jgi:hypothetical protein